MRDLKGGALRLKEDATLVAIDDQATVLDVENRCYYDMNETAFAILKLTEEGISLDGMRTELLSRFDVSEERAGADLDAFVEELLALGLIEVVSAGAGGRAAGGATGEKRAYRPPLLEEPAPIAVGVQHNFQ